VPVVPVSNLHLPGHQRPDHYAVRNYGDFPRLLERILIADEPQYADS